MVYQGNLVSITYKRPHFNQHSLSLLLYLVLRASASPAKELKLIQIPIYMIEQEVTRICLIMMTRIFQLIFLLHFFYFQIISIYSYQCQQSSGQKAFRNSCFTIEETGAQNSHITSQAHTPSRIRPVSSGCSGSCRGACPCHLWSFKTEQMPELHSQIPHLSVVEMSVSWVFLFVFSRSKDESCSSDNGTTNPLHTHCTYAILAEIVLATELELEFKTPFTQYDRFELYSSLL